MIPESTIGVVATKGFIPGCIRLGTRSHYNHVVIADGNGGCYEAQAGSGVHHLPSVPYRQVVWLTRMPLSDGQRINVRAWLFGECGTRYNYPAIIVLSLRTLMPWMPHKLLDRWADRRPNQICSELAVNALRYTHVDPFPNRLAATVSPADWLNLALEKEWTA